MSQTIIAMYEDGVLKPSRPLTIPLQSQVRLTFELLENGEVVSRSQNALKALEDLWLHCTIDSHGDRLTRDQLNERR